MASVECVLEVMEQPAERVKFRTEVKRKFSEKKNTKSKSASESTSSKFKPGSWSSLPAARATFGPGET